MYTNLSSVNSIDEMLSAEADDGTEAWKQEFSDRMEEIIDRKRSSIQGRETALISYNYYLMSRYAYDLVDKKLSELVPALLKSVKNESSDKETCLALKGMRNFSVDPCVRTSRLTTWQL
jgi:hypothetical protein